MTRTQRVQFEAELKAAAKRPALALYLLDYEMPEQSGAEVYEKIFQNPALRHIPVVFLTGVSDRERIAAVLAMRPRGNLLKPIDSERLKKTVEEIVG